MGKLISEQKIEIIARLIKAGQISFDEMVILLDGDKDEAIQLRNIDATINDVNTVE